MHHNIHTVIIQNTYMNCIPWHHKGIPRPHLPLSPTHRLPTQQKNRMNGRIKHEIINRGEHERDTEHIHAYHPIPSHHEQEIRGSIHQLNERDERTSETKLLIRVNVKQKGAPSHHMTNKHFKIPPATIIHPTSTNRRNAMNITNEILNY